MTEISASNPWWRGAVVYQIYPRSYVDANGDGLGDLPGIISKLDYIASLGVDAVWLSPIYPSPQADFGYDVSDYCGIEPAYGTLADFDRLLEAAHKRGLKLILDQVLSHTSIEHEWFQMSRSSRDNPKADWYVWAEPKDDGTVPNNWLAAFGGPAWSYWPERRQYYHHKFYREQPKLNLHNPECAAAVLRSVEFWLARGVDGFRLDVANAYFHDPDLTDNPAIPAAQRGAFEWGHPPRMQRHSHDANRPDNFVFLERLRSVVDRFPDRFVFGEISEQPERIKDYVGDKRLHSVYAFDFLEDQSFAAEAFRTAYARWQAWPGFFPCIAFSNHDFLRPVTRWQRGQKLEARDDALAKLSLALLLTLEGNALLYQGEELGLPEADIALARIQDPVGRLYYPLTKGRDGCRTPMPWTVGGPNAGFGAGVPWLPIPDIHRTLSVDAQEQLDGSVLQFARAFIRLRKAHPALTAGKIRFLDADEGILSFERIATNEHITCVFNLSRDERDVLVAHWFSAALSPLPGCARIAGDKLHLGPLSAHIVVR
jgi:alpha-glucosidase